MPDGLALAARRRGDQSGRWPLLAEGQPGASLKRVLVEYGPGGYSRSHRHAKSAIIHATVTQRAVRSKVNDGPVKIYRTGQN